MCLNGNQYLPTLLSALLFTVQSEEEGLEQAISVILWPSQGVCSETPLLPSHLLLQLEQIRKKPLCKDRTFFPLSVVPLKINHNKWHLHTYNLSSNHQHYQGMNKVNEGCQNSIPIFTAFGW